MPMLAGIIIGILLTLQTLHAAYTRKQLRDIKKREKDMAATIDDILSKSAAQADALAQAEQRITAIQAAQPDPAKVQAAADAIDTNTARINALGVAPAQ